MSAVQITYVANASTGAANVTTAGLSGVTGIASYLAYYDNNAYSKDHAANLGWSSVGGLGGTVQIGDDTFGVTAISTGQLYSDTAISTTLSGLDWIVSAGSSVDVSNTDGTVTGELSSLVYSLFDGSSTAPRTNHTVFGEVGLVEFGNGITTNVDGTVSVSTGYFEIEGLSQYWGNGLGDTDNDGVYDYVQSRDGTDNLVQEAALGLMGGVSGTDGTHTGAITDAFDALGTVVYGTTGGETFTGYASVDTFFLGGGADTVENFTVGAGGDVIVIDSTLYASAAAAAAAVDYTGVNAVLSYGNASGGTDSIEFTGITGGLTADNFILV